ncbi:MAG: EF-hand domain-containing protein [Solirubrobacterales bacterium]
MRMILAVAAGLALAIGTAHAQTGPGGPQQNAPQQGGPQMMGPKGGWGPMMQQMDTNKDGVVTLDEFVAAHLGREQQHFDAMDANHDGMISREEFDQGMRKWAEQRFKALDTNADGKLTPDEMGARRMHRRPAPGQPQQPPQQQR